MANQFPSEHSTSVFEALLSPMKEVGDPVFMVASDSFPDEDAGQILRIHTAAGNITSMDGEDGMTEHDAKGPVCVVPENTLEDFTSHIRAHRAHLFMRKGRSTLTRLLRATVASLYFYYAAHTAFIAGFVLTLISYEFFGG